MSTINPVVTPQPQSMAFKGKNKKVFDALEKLTNTMPDEALKQAALKDIRKPVSVEAYASAHKKAAEILDTLKNREALMGNKDFLKGVNDYLVKGAAKDIYKK